MALQWFFGQTTAPAQTVTGPALLARASHELALTPPGTTTAILAEDFSGFVNASNRLTVSTAVGVFTDADGFGSIALSDSTSNGRFNTGGVPPRYMGTQSPLSWVFPSPANAGGFYITDWGDFSLILSVQLYVGDTLSATYVLPAGEQADGNLVYVGWLDSAQQYTRAVFVLEQQNSNPGDWDVIGIDSVFLAAFTPVVVPPCEVPAGPFPHGGYASIGGFLTPPAETCPAPEAVPQRGADYATDGEAATIKDYAATIPVGTTSDRFTLEISSVGADPMTISDVEWAGWYFNNTRRI